MQFLRRLTLVDFALFAALIVVGILAIANQRATTGAAGGGVAVTASDVNALGGALDDLFVALAEGQRTEAPFTAIADIIRNAGDTTLAPAVTALGTAYAMRNDDGVVSALRTINGIAETMPFAAYLLNTFANGTLSYGLEPGPVPPATGREWVRLVWIDGDIDDPFLGWQIASGEATWTAEPGNAAVSLAFSIPGEGYSGTLRLEPAGPGALMEARATFSAPLSRTEVALGEPAETGAPVLIRDAGESANARPGQPWSGETRLGEPPDLLDELRNATAITWTAIMPDGRTFLMRIKTGESGRTAVAAVFPA